MALRPRTIGNPLARSPLMRKGGVHRKARSGQRQNERDELDAALDEWHRGRAPGGNRSAR